MPKMTKAEYLFLKVRGMNDADIARKLGVTRQAVHYLGKRYGLPSGSKIDKIASPINQEEDGFLTYARSMRSSEQLDARIAAIFIYHSVIRAIVNHILSVLRHLTSISTHKTSFGQVTINVKKDDAPGNVYRQFETLALFDFPEKEALLKMLQRFLNKTYHLGNLLSHKSIAELAASTVDQFNETFNEAEEIIAKYNLLLNLLQEILEHYEG